MQFPEPDPEPPEPEPPEPDPDPLPELPTLPDDEVLVGLSIGKHSPEKFGGIETARVCATYRRFFPVPRTEISHIT